MSIPDELIGLKEKTSSGSSTVYLDEKEDTVYQKFISKETAARIADIMLKLMKKGRIEYNILFQTGFGPRKQIHLQEKISYGVFEYITPFRFWDENGTIAWNYIKPLNDSEKTMSANFLSKNYIKIWYDISKALLALKSIGIMHNDTVIDNIGIRNGKFVLFDFDGSGTPETKGKDFIDDFTNLRKSFEFRGVKVEGAEKLQGINSTIEFVSKLKGITLQEAFRYLESLEIEDV
jgi:hypothetical protein